ncbi:MAG: methylenetetrahydrofolate reductase [Pseudolabrys sp.]
MNAYTLEATRPSADELARLAALVPPGQPLYLSHVPSQTLGEMSDLAIAVRRAGLEPVLHLGARRIVSADGLAECLRRACGEADMRRVLVIGGDIPQPVGPYADALALIRNVDWRAVGIEEIGVAGHPQGHPVVPAETLVRALRDKLAAARDAGLRTHIVTQFAFSAEPIIAFVRSLREEGATVPVHIGLAGPTKLTALLRYAARCGVAASAQGLMSGAALALARAGRIGPDAILDALRPAAPALGIVAPHYFSFGGLIETARYASVVAPIASGRAITRPDQKLPNQEPVS